MHYSGMVPGWLAREYRRSEATIALAPLVEAAGIEWRQTRAVAIDPQANTVTLGSGEKLTFALCSVATGGTGRAASILGDDPRLLDIRPIDRFMDRWMALRDGEDTPRNIAIVGGGAGGVELAFGLRNSEGAPSVTLYSGADGPLPDHSDSSREKVCDEMTLQGIRVAEIDARFENDELKAGEFATGSPDLVVAAIGSAAPDWPKASGLPVDDDGFIKVGANHQVEGFSSIFAAGDIARRTDRRVPHSGVHAVYAGPVLAKNLRRKLSGDKRLATYNPRGMNFYLLNTCRGEAILSYGPLALQGRWLRRLKDWLDRRWIRRFSDRDDLR